MGARPWAGGDGTRRVPMGVVSRDRPPRAIPPFGYGGSALIVASELYICYDRCISDRDAAAAASGVPAAAP